MGVKNKQGIHPENEISNIETLLQTKECKVMQETSFPSSVILINCAFVSLGLRPIKEDVRFRTFTEPRGINKGFCYVFLACVTALI